MINKIKSFLCKLDIPTAQNYAKSYFNVNFSEEELKELLPLLCDSCEDYLDPTKKDLFINRMTAATSDATTSKVLKVLDYLTLMYGLAQNRL